jgi:putative two-component system response regulator
LRHTILLVDDEPSVTIALSRQLHRFKQDWQVLEIWSASGAWLIIHERPVDLLVLDVAMPVRSGFDLLEDMAAGELLESIPVVMLTGHGDSSLKRRALELGASELLDKPVETIDLVARISNVLKLKGAMDRLKTHQAELEGLVAERTLNLEWSRMSIAVRLAKIAEMRDEDTGNHVVRVGYFAEEIARTLGLDSAFRSQILLAAPMHDIGKLAIPDAILLKRGVLTTEEWAVMRTHCELGAKMLQAEPRMPTTSMANSRSTLPGEPPEDTVLFMAAGIALNHHEKWNGEGYPLRLKRDEIPIESRIVAVADVFDALTTNRPYRTPMDESTALEMMMPNGGKHFDQEVLNAFFACFPKISEMRRSLLDPEGAAFREAA